jgi:predicted phosphate transport protein (TIGR00153 family)
VGLGSLLFREQREVEERLDEYLDHWRTCITGLRDGMHSFLEEGPGEKVDYHYARVDREESTSDSLRRAVERKLFGKALLPEARGDIMRILEALDSVINRAESTLRQVVIERLEVEPWMHQGLRLLIDKTAEACGCLHEAGCHLLHGQDRPVAELVQRVDEIESRCDHVEDDLLGRLFASDLDLARKLQLKDFVRRISTVSDLAEKAADQINIVSIKRRV